MAKKRRPAVPDDVKKIRERIDYWRRTREKRSPMPEELWQAAVVLARRHGVSPTVRDLNLNHSALKKRFQQAVRRRQKNGSGPAGSFLEIAGADLSGAAMPRTGVEVELQGVDGAKLTVRVPASGNLDVGALAEAFWSREA